MATVQAVVQEGWREILARIYSQDVVEVQAEVAYFKVGEGSFDDVPPKAPITADPTRRDLFSEGTVLGGGGTCEFTNGLTVVTGLGTTFLADLVIGDWIKPGHLPNGATNSPGTPGSEEDGWGQILSVDNDLQVTLNAPYVGATHLLAEARECMRAMSSLGTVFLYPPLTFRKNLLSTDVLFSSAVPAIVEQTCIILAGEANLNQASNPPDFFELGLFDANGAMLIHMTFPLQQKTVAVQLNFILETIF